METRFEVAYPSNVLVAFQELCQHAIKLGRLAEVASAASTIHAELQTNPRSFGDPWYLLRASQQEMFMRGLPPLVVTYAVHRDENIVVVKNIRWHSAS